MVRSGFKVATDSGRKIEEWWYREPDANIGIATGADSGIVVVDVDNVHSLEDLEAEHGDLDTLWAVTGSGGIHLFFAHPGEHLPNSASRIAPGVDVRGDGGYVVAPPSIHPSGRAYRWGLDGHEIESPMPEWLLEAARPPEREPSVPPEDRRIPPSMDSSWGATAYGAVVLRGEARNVAEAPEGQRNETLNRSAYRVGCFVYGGEISELRAEELLLEAAHVAGLPEYEARRTIWSAFSAATADPKTAPKE